jgi:hypothetical protein
MRLALITVAAMSAAIARAEITVDNFEAGELVRYPVVVLRGRAAGDTIAVGRDWPSAHRYPIVRGMYRAIVELTPGANMIVMQAGRTVVRFRIDYRPPTTPLRVLAIWVRASDEGDVNPVAIGEKFDVALKLIQSFYAEAMHDAGYARKTFSLELDGQSKVVVHYVTLPKAGQELRAMENGASWSYIYGELAKQFPEATSHWCTLLGFTRYDAAARKAVGHYALGGGSLGAFGSAGMVYWPATLADAQRVFSDATVVDEGKTLDDSNGRRTVWANAATTFGAMAHEMGHTFGLPHTRDPFSVMSRGFDFFNRTFTVDEPPSARAVGPTEVKPGEYSRWDAFEAARLNWNPYFQPDPPAAATGADPKVSLEGDEVVITAPAGIRVWGADRDDVDPYFVEWKAANNPKEIRTSVKELRARLATRLDFRITVVDADGRSFTLDAPPASMSRT